ncbi:hypothetical protein TorRG33x02_051520 [Trema orientale]|uniref:Transmembrane protein n=1 Tax=Trema orientale TaxID=63057 RepID=A0A2P5FM88_TREOI|nr:hypothetical protein TorRG33x02_051520 [Trema orientale]
MESPLLVFPEKKVPYLSTFDIIKSAIGIPLRSYSFVVLTCLTSLPFFTALLVPKLVPHSFFEGPYSYFSSQSIISNDLIHDTALALDFTTRTLKTWLLDLARFLVAITTVYSASKIHTSGLGSTGLRDLIEHVIKAVAKTKYWFAPIFTFWLMTVFSDYFLDAATYWGVWGPLVWSRTLLFQIVHVITYAGLMVIWSEYSALWHVGVVISILEENVSSGFEVFLASAGLSRGKWTRGTILMVLDLAWRVGLRLPTLFPMWGFNYYGSVWYKVLETYLVCVGRVMSWTVWVVFYYDCKNSQRRNNKNLVVEEVRGSEILVRETESKN